MTVDLWPDATDEADELFDRWLDAAEPGVLLVAIDDDHDDTDRAIGFIWIGQRGYAEGCDTSPVAFVEGWYVNDDRRRGGVGAALMHAAQEWSRAAGYRELASDTWLWNEISIEAHTRLGFAEVERLVAFAMKL
jgi:aminoglycoside 6'-N-acetyltransferase I